MNISPGLSRREFFGLAGGGIVMLIGLEPDLVHPQDRRLYPEDFNAYLVIGKAGRVTVFSGKIEMGQGVLTSQAQMVAEELGVALSSVDMVLGDTDRCPWDMGTFGSLTTRMFGPALRAAAAQARLTLLSLAAAQLGVPQERLAAKDGIVTVVGEPLRTVSYGELSRGARIAKVVDAKAVLRAASQFNVMGRSPPRLDGIDKVTGAATYTADVRLPGMLYARILRPPMHGAKLLHLDTLAAEAFPGARLVRDGDLVAVLHAEPEAAAAALGRVQSRWELPQVAVDTESIFDHIARAPAGQKTTTDRGDIGAARAGAAKLFEATYRKGYAAHAPIETHAALADVRDGKATVWASTQTPFPTRDLIAQALKLSPKEVRVITPFVGGGFGGKSAGAQAVEAARLSHVAGRPVQVAWTREEEFFFDTFDPAAVVKITSGVDRSGRISLWDHVVYAAGERGSSLFYDVGNARTSGRVKVVRIVCAQDMGIVVNPDGARMQIEGGLTMGLGYALSEELRFRGGEILDRNFDGYSIPRFADAPRIQAVLVKNDELAPQGGGEPSITTAGAVVANAVFDATGVRMFRLPMTPARLRQAIVQSAA